MGVLKALVELTFTVDESVVNFDSVDPERVVEGLMDTVPTEWRSFPAEDGIVLARWQTLNKAAELMGWKSNAEYFEARFRQEKEEKKRQAATIVGLRHELDTLMISHTNQAGQIADFRKQVDGYIKGRAEKMATIERLQQVVDKQGRALEEVKKALVGADVVDLGWGDDQELADLETEVERIERATKELSGALDTIRTGR